MDVVEAQQTSTSEQKSVHAENHAVHTHADEHDLVIWWWWNSELLVCWEIL